MTEEADRDQINVPADIGEFFTFIESQESYPAVALRCIRQLASALVYGGGWHESKVQITKALAGGSAKGDATLTAAQRASIERWKKAFNGPERLIAYLVHCDMIRKFALAARHADAQQSSPSHAFNPSSAHFWTGFTTLLPQAISAIPVAAGYVLPETWTNLGLLSTSLPYLTTLISVGNCFAWYWEGYDPHNSLTEALAGPAYKALGINDNIGRLIDNAHERYFIQHLLAVVSSHSPSINKTERHLAKTPPPLANFSIDDATMSRAWCSWVDAELRAWIKLSFRVNVSETTPGRLSATGNPAVSAAVTKVVNSYGADTEEQAKRLTFCGSRADPGKFVDFQAWRNKLRKTDAEWAVIDTTI